MPQDSGRDFYGILGVGKDADEPALKKAYKKLAMKYHPDRKTGDERMFKEVAEAYAVLSDPEKRKVYDRFGEEGLKAGMTGDQADNMGSGGFGGGFSGGPGGAGGFSMPPEFAENLFSQFFGGSRSNGGFSFMNGADDDEPFMFSSMGGMPGGMGGRMGGGMGGMGGMPGMGGMGAMPGGMGGMSGGSRNGFEDSQRPAKRQKRPPVEKDFSVSLEDLYTSATKKLKITRKLFNESTNSYTDSQQVVELKLKPQMKEGTKFTFKNLGSEEPGYEPADMIFKLKEKPHEKFTRKGDDLYVVVDISLKDALQGGQAIVQTLDKQNIRVPFSTLKESKHEVTLRERGMPNTKTGNKGNLIVRFNVRFPEDSSTRSELVEKLSKV